MSDAPAAEPSQTERRQLVGVLVLVAVAYLQVVQAGFVWDDEPLVVGNLLTGDLGNFGRIWVVDLWESTPVGGDGTTVVYYRPLLLLSLMLERAVYGLWAPGHHLQNLAWHLLAVAMVWRLARRLVPARGALVAAAIFALHPVQSEAVVWVAARNDLMAMALGAGALVLCTEPRPTTRQLVGAGGLALAAALSKESVVVLPVLGAALAWASGRVSLRRIAPLVVGLGLAWTLRMVVGVPASGGLRFEMIEVVAPHLGAALGVLASSLVWPWPLAGARSVEWLYLEPAWKGVVGAVVVLGLVAAGLLVRGRSGRVVRVGLLWIAVSSAPLVVPIVNTGQLGERYLYLPLVGVALVVGALWKDRPLWLAAPVLLAWVATINLRLPDWQNDRTLWSAAAEQLGSPGALAGLAHIDRLEGRNVQALAGFQEALDAPIPDWSACTPLVGTALSLERVVLAGQLGRWAEQRGCGSSPEAGSFLGVWALALARSGDWQGARALRAGAPEDDRGRGAVVDLALALVDHDAARAEALTRRWEGRFDIEAQAAQLLAERDSTTMLQGP